MLQYLVRFGLIGVFATTVHFLVALALIHFYQFDLLYANWIAFGCAFGISYVGNTRYVFQASFQSASFLKFIIVSVVSFATVSLVSYVGEHYAFNRYASMVVIVALVPVVTFLCHRFWTFKKEIHA